MARLLPRANRRASSATVDHNDDTPLSPLLSAVALSPKKRTPESMGEETVQSIRELRAASEVGAGSTPREEAEACVGGTVRVVDSGGEEGGTMSVTGRMVGISAVTLIVSITGGAEEASGDEWPESTGGGVGEGETGTVSGAVGKQGVVSMTQGGVGSICGG